MVKEFNIILAGVGGQGVILLSELLGNAAVKDGLNVRGSEVLGMAVRGGSVSSTIRVGSEVFGPLIPAGKCDILLGMEPAEALRNISYLSPSGLVIINTEAIPPFTVALGKSNYPSLEETVRRLESVSRLVIKMSANQIAKKAGSLLAANIVMLGGLFSPGNLPIELATIKEEIKARFPAKSVGINLRAFDLGYQAGKRAME